MSKNADTLEEKWNSKLNRVSIKKNLQGRLKEQFRKNASAKKRSGNKKES